MIKLADYFDSYVSTFTSGTFGDTYFELKASAPTWLVKAIKSAHGAKSDRNLVYDVERSWVYDVCYLFCQAIDIGNIGNAEDVVDFDDDYVRNYEGSFYDWANRHSGWGYFKDQDAKDSGPFPDAIEYLKVVMNYTVHGIVCHIFSAWLAEVKSGRITEAD